MRRILITGVSSGIGRALTKKLVQDGVTVWGIARRIKLLRQLKEELKNSSNFIYSQMDVSEEDNWKRLITQMKRKNFLPQIVIFNAGVQENDLSPRFNPQITKKVFEINFFSVIFAVEHLLKFVKLRTQFIAISSLSSLRGSGIEGIAYPASKAALSIAFESLYQKYKQKYSFKTIYFGPVATGMGPFKRYPLVLQEKEAVGALIKAMESDSIIHHHPGFLLFAFRLIRLFPPKLYFLIISKIEGLHKNLGKR